jgi:Leucine-rich repeat (LRR) protein
LKLEANRLDIVPKELGNLTALVKLKLEDNQLTSVPPKWKQGGALERSGCVITR